MIEGRGRRVVRTLDPGGTALGRGIRDLLLHRPLAVSPEAELALFFADRAQNLAETIRPALAGGGVVLADRFTDSTVAYQGYGRGLGAERVLAADAAITGGFRPHLTLLLDAPVEAALRRSRSGDRIGDEARGFHERVRAGFLEIQRADPARVRLLDGLLAEEAVFAEASRIVAPMIGFPR